jgi:hypothetical protein
MKFLTAEDWRSERGLDRAPLKDAGFDAPSMVPLPE